MRLRTFGGLWIESDPPVAPLGARRMALLALVASAGKRGVSRERVAGILWGEAGEENARHTLAQNLYTLRRETGRDWIVGAPKLCLNSGATSDIGDFLEAVEADDHVRVAELYTGTFLLDFQLSGAPEFERWVEEERATLRRTVLRSLEILAEGAGATNRAPTTDRAPTANRDPTVWWRRLTEIDGLNGQYAAGLIRSLSASGDMVAALAHARAHEQLVRRELESDVDPAVRALVATMRHQAGKSLSFTPPEDPPEKPAVEDPIEPAMSRPLRDSPRRLIIAGLALAAILAVIVVRRPAHIAQSRALAVGTIRSSDPAAPAAVLRDMLATSLGGIRELTVVANSRLLELMPEGADSAASSIADAARRAGAGEVFEGEMVAVPNGLRLSLRRVNLRTGVLQRGYSLLASDPASLVDSAAAAIARDLGVETPSRSVATRRTASPAAYALYERGLQVLYRGDARTAHALMRAAWEHDTTFAMAAFQGWLASGHSSPFVRDEALLEAARRLAPRAIDRERLLIASAVSGRDSAIITSVAIAETLAVRYPEDPEGHLALGKALEVLGDFPSAIAAYERAALLDSAAGAAAGPYCRLCGTFYRMSVAYMWADSLDAALRTARRVRVLRPGETSGWAAMAEPLFRLGRRAEAQAALDSSEVLSIPTFAPREMGRRDMIRWGDFATLDHQLTGDLAHPSSEVRASAAWLMLISLRNQGRLNEANALASARSEPWHRAFLPMVSGDPAESARRFRAEAERHHASASPPGVRARAVTWDLTLAGTALAETGDTAGVLKLADSVEQIGRHSTFGRDLRLHHFLRGLVHQRGGRHAEAIDAFRSAVHSLSDGYTRINYEMARCLIEAGQPEEAIAVLRPALRGGVDGSNTYMTHTELHETIARAFEAAGLRDSARVHYGAVERAWRNADPQFLPRYQLAKARSSGS